jgi:hypothetical protein
MLGEMRLGNIVQIDAGDQPSLARRTALDLNGVVEHATAMFEQPRHGHIVDVAKNIHVRKPRFGAMAERIAGRVKLPSLRFGHMKPLSKVVTLNAFQGLTFCVED